LAKANRKIPPTEYWLARWQSGAYFINQTLSVPEALCQVERTDVKACGRFEAVYWRLFGNPPSLTVWTNQDSKEDWKNNRVLVASVYSFEQLGRVLNFGAPYSEIGSIKWNGDTFETTNELHQQSTLGRLERDEQGRAKLLHLHLKRHDRRFATLREIDWLVTYFYETNIFAPYLPNKFLIAASDEIRVWQPIDQITILSLKTNSQPMDATQFAAEQVLHGPAKSLSIVSGTNLLYKRGTNWVKASSTRKHAKVLTKRKIRSTYLVLAALALVLPSAFLIHWRIKKMRRAKKNRSTQGILSG
jgi:hypothetical protein